VGVAAWVCSPNKYNSSLQFKSHFLPPANVCVLEQSEWELLKILHREKLGLYANCSPTRLAPNCQGHNGNYDMLTLRIIKNFSKRYESEATTHKLNYLLISLANHRHVRDDGSVTTHKFGLVWLINQTFSANE